MVEQHPIEAAYVARLYCPACDPRAIGLPAEGERRDPVLHASYGPGEALWECQHCRCRFSPGSARKHGASGTPLPARVFAELTAFGWCKCDWPMEPQYALDVNYLDDEGIERRWHGWIHRTCGGITQTG